MDTNDRDRDLEFSRYRRKCQLSLVRSPVLLRGSGEGDSFSPDVYLCPSENLIEETLRVGSLSGSSQIFDAQQGDIIVQGCIISEIGKGRLN